MIHLNAFTQCSVCPQSKGQWKHPLDRSSAGYRDLDYYAEIARTLERGRFDAFFFADIHGTYDAFRGTRDAAVRHAVQFPCNDPTLIIPALAMATRHLGFATTYSTTYHPPYQAAKLFSTLDHLTKGRVGWNVVTSYLPDAEKNGLGKILPHDERYDRADEYMEVVYKLWEQSWEEDAIVRDTERDIHTDPSKVHEIRHHGKYFDVLGPHLCEPSLQRTPVIYQAGLSGRGMQFAATHAEAVFVVFPNTTVCRAYCDRIRELAAEHGRDPKHLKILMAMAPVVGTTDAEARRKHEEMMQYASPEGAFALFSGWTGIDLSKYGPGDKIDNVKSDGMQFLAQYFSSVDSTREWTMREIADFVSIASVIPVPVGNYRRITDELERWIVEGGVDGFNYFSVDSPVDYESFVDLVVPELQRRGLLRKEYEASTLREHYFGKGQQRLANDHPGAAYSCYRPRENATGTETDLGAGTRSRLSA
ncbi:MAG TPA: LLM class flavin-dependent oxidoreductase [Candidatus Binataceae bacterium]|nr:LLM class flavin-dependent oxidoreductase [Candidatus Binataceae bacterium]